MNISAINFFLISFFLFNRKLTVSGLGDQFICGKVYLTIADTSEKQTHEGKENMKPIASNRKLEPTFKWEGEDSGLWFQTGYSPSSELESGQDELMHTHCSTQSATLLHLTMFYPDAVSCPGVLVSGSPLQPSARCSEKQTDIRHH